MLTLEIINLDMKIPFNKPPYIPLGQEEISQAILSGNVSGRGPYTKKCEEWLREKNPTLSGVLLATSCTHALEASAILLNLSEQDEVIVPSYTYVTSALAFYLHGAQIRFCDISADTLNIDEKLIEKLITPRTKAIVVVHYAGISCEMDKIMELARKYNLVVIEDNAHGLFGKYKGVNLGTIGDLSTASFHETKNISCGEGGALFINNKKYQQRAEIIFEKGTNRSQFINGQIDKYSWVDKGSSYILSDILAALLFAQLQHSSEIQDKRKILWNNYFSSLQTWAQNNGVLLASVPDYCDQTYHMFYMIMPDQTTRDDFIRNLKDNDISAVFHYQPLDSSEMGKKIQLTNQAPCPNSAFISERIVRLPLFFDLSLTEQLKIIEIIKSYNV